MGNDSISLTKKLSRIKTNTTANIMLVIGTILLIIGSTVICGFGFLDLQNILNSNIGYLLSPSGDPKDEITVILATNQIILTREELSKGFDLAKAVHFQYDNVSVSYPVQVYLKDNRITVNAKILSPYGNLIAEIYDNQWQNVEFASWDRNYNDYAFEAIADVSNDTMVEVVPVLQIIIANRNTILVGCYIDSPMGKIFATIDGGIVLNPTKEEKNEIASSTFFKYPSEKYLHALRKNSYVRNYTEYDFATNSWINKTLNIQFPSSNPLFGSYCTIATGVFVGVAGGVIDLYSKKMKKEIEDKMRKDELGRLKQHHMAKGNLYYRIKRKKRKKRGRKSSASK